jgi:hypothetical protein
MTRARVIAVLLVIGGATLAAWLFDTGWWRALVATVVAALVIRIGYAKISGMAQPVPEPPDPGELRKVKLTYRCSICGAEVKMTVAPQEDPEPPRHCQEDMELLAPIE